jgi:hypothetical protein
MILYFDKSTPVVLATEGIKILEMFTPNKFVIA